ncbi:MAG: hypothetical protein Q9181_000088 [Wetmoreana brouardii]
MVKSQPVYFKLAMHGRSPESLGEMYEGKSTRHKATPAASEWGLRRNGLGKEQGQGRCSSIQPISSPSQPSSRACILPAALTGFRR